MVMALMTTVVMMMRALPVWRQLARGISVGVVPVLVLTPLVMAARCRLLVILTVMALTIMVVSPGQWYFRRSTAGFGTISSFGHAGAAPLVGDYDGDGLDDFGLYNASGLSGVSQPGTWLFLRSTLGRSNTQFGYDGTVPINGEPAE